MTILTIAANQGTMGGGEVMLFAIAEAARELGREVTVVAPQTPGQVLVEARRRGFHTVGIVGETTAAYLRALREWDRKHRRGLLWCNGLRPAFATTGHPDRIVHLHQMPVGKHRALVRFARRGALSMLVPSQAMQAQIPDSRTLWNWSAPISATRTPADETGGRPRFTIGYLGRFSTDKGVRVLCEAMQRLELAFPGRFELLLAGEDRFVSKDDSRQVDAAIARTPNVRRLGWIDREEFFAAVDLPVFPSVWAEPFGLVVTEAMSAHCPFVITDAGALPEVAGEAHRWVAKAGDPDSLAETILAAADADQDPSTAAAYARWQEHFAPDAGIRRVSRILDSVDRKRDPNAPKVAIVHDYLTQRGGAERVALTLADGFPDAPVLTTVYEPEGTYPGFRNHEIGTSPLQKCDTLRHNFRLALPFYDWAVDRLEVPPDVEAVVVSTTAFAHGIRTEVPKVVYCHSPAHFMYCTENYLGQPWWRSLGGWALTILKPGLIRWDQRAAPSADKYLCNSTYVQQRIRDVYGIEATVVHPPAALGPDGPQEPVPEVTAPDFFLVVSRLLPYKNVDVVLEAFRDLPNEHVVVVGRGPAYPSLHRTAPPNVTFLQGLSDPQMRWLYDNCAAVIAPSNEDFGLSPVEGYSFGKPTVALRAGGYLDTVVEGVTGWYFDRPDARLLKAAVRQQMDNPLKVEKILDHAELFTPERFIDAIKREVDTMLEQGRRA